MVKGKIEVYCNDIVDTSELAPIKIRSGKVRSTRIKTRREWRVRVKAANGRIIFVSSEGYTKQSHAIDMAMKYLNPQLKFNLK